MSTTEEFETSTISENPLDENENDGDDEKSQNLQQDTETVYSGVSSWSHPSLPEKSTRKKGRKIVPRVSNRTEYLSRPKKDYLDVLNYQPRPDGCVPENGMPTWAFLPLQNKIPAAGLFKNAPMTKMCAPIFVKIGESEFDQFDIYDHKLPVKSYECLFDPNMKVRFAKKSEKRNLVQRGLVSESGKVITSFQNINEYREYHRRILADRVQQKLREEDEEEKRKRLFQREEKAKKRTQTELRSYIKNVVYHTNEGSMENQRERDIRILRREINFQKLVSEKNVAKKQHEQKLLQQYYTKKYMSDDWKKSARLKCALEDMKRIEKLCKQSELEKLDKNMKRNDFFDRKTEFQLKWLQKGIEVENMDKMDRDDRIEARKDGHPRKMKTGKHWGILKSKFKQANSEPSSSNTTVYHDAENPLNNDEEFWSSESTMQDESSFQNDLKKEESLTTANDRAGSEAGHPKQLDGKRKEDGAPETLEGDKNAGDENISNSPDEDENGKKDKMGQ